MISVGDFCVVQPAGAPCASVEQSPLLAPLRNGSADVVLGWRTPDRAVTRLINLLTGLQLTDATSGHIAFRASLRKSIPLKSTGAGMVSEMIIRFARLHARFAEVPVSCPGRGDHNWALAGGILRACLPGPDHTDPAADMLVAMSQAQRFNGWMADTLRRYLSGDILEIGAGIGNLTILLAGDGHRYTASDSDAESLSHLRSRMAVDVKLCDFTKESDIAEFRQTADTVICLNVLEHVSDDLAGLANIRSCLRPNGKAVVLVPQGPQLFGTMDEVLQHKRRYTRDELKGKMEAAGFDVRQITEFNRVTWPGWYLNSRVLRRRTLSRGQLQLLNLLVPLVRRIDERLPWPGTSLIAIGYAAR